MTAAEIIKQYSIGGTGKYCTYLTVYSGDKLPPFYIGFTTMSNIGRGYNGTVTSQKFKAIWDAERKEHPELFTTHVLSQHKDKLEANLREGEVQVLLHAHTDERFINQALARPAFFANQSHSDETKQKIGDGLRLAHHLRTCPPEERQAHFDKLAEEKRQRRIEANRKIGFNKRGTTLSQEVRDKVSASMKGIKHVDTPARIAGRLRQAEKMKGRTWTLSDEIKTKFCLSQQSARANNETNLKMDLGPLRRVGFYLDLRNLITGQACRLPNTTYLREVLDAHETIQQTLTKRIGNKRPTLRANWVQKLLKDHNLEVVTIPVVDNILPESFLSYSLLEQDMVKMKADLSAQFG